MKLPAQSHTSGSWPIQAWDIDLDIPQFVLKTMGGVEGWGEKAYNCN